MDQLKFIIKKYEMDVENKRHLRKRTHIIRSIKKYWEANNSEECPICYEPMKIKTIVITKCYHMFCDECIIRHHENNEKCPICRRPVDYYDIIAQISSVRYCTINKKLLDEKKEEEPNESIEVPPQVNQIDIFVATSLTICVSFANLLIGSLLVYYCTVLVVSIVLLENVIVYRLI